MTPSERFSIQYVTGSALAVELGVTRTAIAQARSDGRLPDAIAVENGLFYVWEREAIMPHVEAWKKRRAQKRGNK